MKTCKHSKYTHAVAIMLMLCVATLGMSGPANADIVPTADLYQQSKVDASKAELKELVDRQEVRSKMISMGVDVTDVDARIDSMTDQEVFELQQQIDSLPAGEGALGVIIAVLVIFILTDIAGATDIFPGV